MTTKNQTKRSKKKIEKKMHGFTQRLAGSARHTRGENETNRREAWLELNRMCETESEWAYIFSIPKKAAPSSSDKLRLHYSPSSLLAFFVHEQRNPNSWKNQRNNKEFFALRGFSNLKVKSVKKAMRKQWLTACPTLRKCAPRQE